MDCKIRVKKWCQLNCFDTGAVKVHFWTIDYCPTCTSAMSAQNALLPWISSLSDCPACTSAMTAVLGTAIATTALHALLLWLPYCAQPLPQLPCMHFCYDCRIVHCHYHNCPACTSAMTAQFALLPQLPCMHFCQYCNKPHYNDKYALPHIVCCTAAVTATQGGRACTTVTTAKHAQHALLPSVNFFQDCWPWLTASTALDALLPRRSGCHPSQPCITAYGYACTTAKTAQHAPLVCLKWSLWPMQANFLLVAFIYVCKNCL